MIDYGLDDADDPVWLRAQREQAHEAGVGLDATDPYPPCTGGDAVAAAHEFRLGAEVCVCGRYRVVMSASGITFVERPGYQTPTPLADIEPSGLDDEGVRRLEHPEEFQ